MDSEVHNLIASYREWLPVSAIGMVKRNYP